MKYLIYGAGTIGITYAWLLSKKHEVDVLAKPERLERVSNGIVMNVKDLRKQSTNYEKNLFYPHCVTQFSKHYDGVLVCVNRCE